MHIERRQLVVNAPAGMSMRSSAAWAVTGLALCQLAVALARHRRPAGRGAGLSRGRRDPDEVRVGDALDFWRVETVEWAGCCAMRAEMKLPGEAWLQFETLPRGDGPNAADPDRLPGAEGVVRSAYWYGLYPFHGLILAT